MSDYTEKNSNLIPKIDIPCFAWNSQAEQGLLFFKAKSLTPKPVMQRCKDGEWYEDRQTDRDSFGDVAERKGDGTGTGRNV